MKNVRHIFLLLVLAAACDPYEGQLYKAFDEQTVSGRLAADPAYSMWVEMLRGADLYNAMNLGAGVYTCFVADNEAVTDYLRDNGYATVADIPQDELNYLMRYHIINGAKISSSNLLLKLSMATLSGDYLTAGVDVDTEERFIDNGEGKPVSRIITRDIAATNGLIHVLDRVLRPITETLWGLLAQNPDYSIFAEAVRQTGLDAHLDNTYQTYLDVQVRDNKTVFVVSDAVFAEHGIADYEALASHFGSTTPASTDDPLYRFVNYHIIDNLSGYAELTSFPKGYHSMIVTNRSGIRGYSVLDTLGVITFNPQAKEDAFHISDTRRDIPANNGYIHEIDNLGTLPEAMAHYVLEWEPTEHIAFSAIPFYRSEKTSSDSAEEFELISGGLSVPGIRYESVPATKAQIWYHSEHLDAVDYKYNDALYWNMGSIGWIEFDTPVLPAGKYRLDAVKSKNSSNGGKSFVYWDGDEASLAGNSEINFVGGVYEATWTTRTLLREEAHTVRFTVGSTGGVCGIDRFRFTPID